MELLQDREKLQAMSPDKALDYLGLKLAFLSCKVFSPTKGTVCAFFDCSAPDTLAFPGAISPENADYLAVLLSLAQQMKGKKRPHNLLFVFYPTGNAKEVCLTGIFRQYRVSHAFSLAFREALTPGVIAGRKQEMLSRSCELTVTVAGQGALDAGIAFYNQATALESALPEEIFRMLKFSRLAGNEETARIEGVLRVFQDDIYNDMRAGLATIARELQEQTGCDLQLSMSDGYPAVLNPADLFDQVRKIAPIRELKVPEMDTDEFSVFQRYAPGLLLLIGAGTESPQKALEFLQSLTEKLS